MTFSLSEQKVTLREKERSKILPEKASVCESKWFLVLYTSVSVVCSVLRTHLLAVYEPNVSTHSEYKVRNKFHLFMLVLSSIKVLLDLAQATSKQFLL